MKQIESFTVDHLKLQPGLYLSRQDKVGERVLNTFDIRLTAPNDEPVMNTAEIHTLEHLGATFLRNHPTHQEAVIYFGPMGCRTGFYVILTDALSHQEVLALMVEMFDFMATYEGEIPGATAIECGNYLDQNLPMARYHAKRYSQVLATLDGTLAY